VWRLAAGRIRPGAIVDLLSNQTISAGDEIFSIVLADGRTIRASELKLSEPPRIENLTANPKAVQAAQKLPGKSISARLASEDGSLQVQWQAVLRDNANDIRQELTLRPQGKDLAISEIVFDDFSATGAKTVGSVRGSPVVAGNLFFACENPLANAFAARFRAAFPSKRANRSPARRSPVSRRQAKCDARSSATSNATGPAPISRS
jgi:hypothetical protein